MASYVATLEGEDRATHGLADTTPFKRALEKDPSNERAKAALTRLETQGAVRPPPTSRYLAAGTIGLTATVAALVIGLVGRKRPAAPVAPPSEPLTPPKRPSKGGAGEEDEQPETDREPTGDGERSADDEPARHLDETPAPDTLPSAAPPAGSGAIDASDQEELHHDDGDHHTEDEANRRDRKDETDV
jgi:hypothetical protein